MMFTDIVGSTQLWENAPAAMSLALARHDAIMRAVIARNHGYVFKTVGDAFCAVFPLAIDAVACSVDAQRALTNESWPDGARIAVRMALHTGASEERDGDYFGPTVNRAARLEAVAHGNQVVLSGATYELVAGVMPSDVNLRDLGKHLLKDLSRPESIYQLVVEGLPDSFPPLRSLDDPSTKHNLPAQSTSFIGREAELTMLSDVMEHNRLVTITGPGGTGKSRLALQMAADRVGLFDGGVWFVELAPLSDPLQIAAMLSALLQAGAGDPTDTLVQALSGHDTLIILDNCEHLLAASAGLVDGLLRRCPGARFVATSREALGVNGEYVLRIPPLGVVDQHSALNAEVARTSDAVRLFEDRARAQQSGFQLNDENAASVVSLCRELDGVPLIIELAAAKLRTMSVSDVEGRLANQLSLLTGGSRSASPRQQTLRAMIDWSFDLLDEQQRSVLCQLSVFAGDWSLEAAETVCGGADVDAEEIVGLVTALVDKSLVQSRLVGASMRYWLLESIRHYADEHLQSYVDAPLATKNRHAQWCLAFAERASAQFNGPDQYEWLSRVDVDLENIERAMRFLSEGQDTVEGALRIAVALRTFFLNRFRTDEGAALTMGALNGPGAKSPSPLRAQAFEVAGRCFNQSRQVEKSRECLVLGLDMAREVGDPVAQSRLMLLDAYLEFHDGHREAAITAAERGVELARGVDLVTLASSLRLCGALRSELGPDHLDRARAETFEALTLVRDQHDVRSEIRLTEDLGLMEIQSGNLEAAGDYFARAEELVRADAPGLAKQRRLANIALNQTTIALVQRDAYRAARSLSSSVNYDRTWSELVPYQVLFGALYASAVGDVRAAAILHGASDEFIRRNGMELESVEAHLRGDDHARHRAAIGDGAFAALLSEGANVQQDAAFTMIVELLNQSGDPGVGSTPSST
jgi:predicted ATPase/class 3 adenylate cyclase